MNLPEAPGRCYREGIAGGAALLALYGLERPGCPVRAGAIC